MLGASYYEKGETLDEEESTGEDTLLEWSYKYTQQQYSAVADYSYQTANSVWSSLPSPVQFILETAWSGVPNFQEVFYSSAATTFVEKAVKGWVDLGDGLAVKEIFRDIAKFPTVLVSWWGDVEYGHSGYKYDEANVWAQGVKIVCKSTLIGGAYVYAGPIGVELGAPFINMLCEIPARTIIEVGREKQKLNDEDTPFFEFLADHLTLQKLSDGVAAAFAKKTMASIMQVLVGRLEMIPQLTKDLNDYLMSFFNKLEYGSLFFSAAEQTTDYVTKVLRGISETYILSSAARAAQETVIKIVNTEWVKFHVEEHLKKGDLLRFIFGMLGILDTHENITNIDEEYAGAPTKEEAQQPGMAGELPGEAAQHDEL